MTNALLIAVFLPAPLVVLLAYALNAPAKRIGLTDASGGRKRHSGTVPLTGGLAIFIALAMSFALGVVVGDLRPADAPYWGAALGLLVAIGIADDIRHRSVSLRLTAQFTAAALLVFGAGYEARFLAYLADGTPLSIGYFTYAFTCLALVGLINALNMSDGIDGLAGGYVGIAGACLLASVWVLGTAHETIFLIACLSAVMGFLLVNLGIIGAEKIFLGDTGSTLLGFVLGGALIYYGQPLGAGYPMPDTHIPATLALWSVALPVFDCVATSLRRILAGRSPFDADRAHIHHIVLRAGFSPMQTRTALLGLALSAYAFGALLYWLGGDALALFGFLALGIGYFLGMGKLLTTYRNLKKSRAK